MHFFVLEVWISILCLHCISIEYCLPIFDLSDHMLTLKKLLVKFGMAFFNYIVTDVSLKKRLINFYLLSDLRIVLILRLLVNF